MELEIKNGKPPVMLKRHPLVEDFRAQKDVLSAMKTGQWFRVHEKCGPDGSIKQRAYIATSLQSAGFGGMFSVKYATDDPKTYIVVRR